VNVFTHWAGPRHNKEGGDAGPLLASICDNILVRFVYPNLVKEIAVRAHTRYQLIPYEYGHVLRCAVNDSEAILVARERAEYFPWRHM
jgi:uncharacterized protein YaiL (DUF2058 family)